ncbi:hypothetical protein [Thalassotalea eurytherma]|uniref:Uncharacterized protein n=1 Tax=Thalassotalea eurytherma TaxID=1144278 RepID=A0ABQ6H5Z3_9GAMM|nr:hypothetical protein [Thalassotalea eurytherma]GLX81861.1 hypothetical protein theurythT_13130 [Thalassotalea eurytherma]
MSKEIEETEKYKQAKARKVTEGNYLLFKSVIEKESFQVKDDEDLTNELRKAFKEQADRKFERAFKRGELRTDKSVSEEDKYSIHVLLTRMQDSEFKRLKSLVKTHKYRMIRSSEQKTINITNNRLQKLKELKEQYNAKSYDELIRVLLMLIDISDEAKSMMTTLMKSTQK